MDTTTASDEKRAGQNAHKNARAENAAQAPVLGESPGELAGPNESHVVDRHGRKIRIRFDEITRRNEALCREPQYGQRLGAIDAPLITAQVVARFANGMTTRQLDALTVGVCTGLTTHHPDYARLAARICVSDLHKRTPAGLDEMVGVILAAAAERRAARYSAEYVGIVRRCCDAINARLDFRRDYMFSFFGFQTLARSYLIRAGQRADISTLLDDVVMERPQHLYMRVALILFCGTPDRRGHEAPGELFAQRLQRAFAYYDRLSRHEVSNATPTMLNAGTEHQQLSSCFQFAPGDDLESLMDTLKATGETAKWSGGVSHRLSAVRAEGSAIKTTGGKSSGIKRYIKVLNELQLYVDQGGNRPGAYAEYLAVWHDDVFTFLKLGRIKGEVLNAPDLKYALMVPDLFMRALRRGLKGGDGQDDWYLFSPDNAPRLYCTWGAEFEELYARYVAEGRFTRKVRARDIIREAFTTWRQTGTPYVLFADHVNGKSMLQHVATITSSNLCTEVTLPTWADFEAKDFNAEKGEHGVCNLGALCLGSFVRDAENGGPPEEHPDVAALLREQVDVAGLMAAARLLTEALDNVIDITFTPTEAGRRSNARHRPLAIGDMGLADVFRKLRLSFGSPEARRVDMALHAAIYYAAACASSELAETRGHFPSMFDRQSGKPSPAAAGKLQPDLWADAGHLAPGWEAEIEELLGPLLPAAAWDALRGRVRRGLLRNCYLTSLMPTASTSNIVGQNECIEPVVSTIYTRKTQAGDFTLVDQYLVAELLRRGLWSDEMRRAIIAADGSVQHIQAIPEDVRRRFKTARELDPRLIVLHAAARGPFVSQSQSLNHFFEELTLPNVLTVLFLAWEKGLPTGSYYMYSAPAAGTQKTSIRAPAHNDEQKARGPTEGAVCHKDDDGCLSCGV
jgi:ribonucleoside-diphosphate reductase alpha subunit